MLVSCSQPGKVHSAQESAVSRVVCVCQLSSACRLITVLQQTAVNQNRAVVAKHHTCATHERHSLSIKCPYRLRAQHVAAGRPRHSSCLWDVLIGPPRKGAGGCRGSDWTAGGDGCRPTEMSGDSREPPELTGAGWGPAPSRGGGAAPSCRTPPPRRTGGRQEVRPPSGRAGLRSDGCWDERERRLFRESVYLLCVHAQP